MTKTINSRLKLQLSNSQKVFEVLNQSVPVLIGIFIFFNPFPHTTAIKEICFYLAVLIVLILVVFRRGTFIFKTPLMLPFGLFVLWVFIGLFFAVNKENSIHDFYSHLLRYIMLYYILINFFNSKKRLINLSWIIISSATLFSFGGLFYYYFISGHSLTEAFAYDFSQIPTNFVSFITLFAAILCLQNILSEKHLNRKLIFVGCFNIILLATVMTKARSSIVAAVFAFIVCLINEKRIAIFLVAVFLVIVATTSIKGQFLHRDVISSLRLDIHFITYEIIKDYPIIGIGFGGQTYGQDIDLKAYQKRVPEKFKRITIIYDPHNMLFSVAVRTGIVGLALFLYIIYIFLKICWKTIRYGKDDFIKSWGLAITSAFVAYFIVGLFEPTFSHMQQVVLFTIFSMITILWRLNQGEAEIRINQLRP